MRGNTPVSPAIGYVDALPELQKWYGSGFENVRHCSEGQIDFMILQYYDIMILLYSLLEVWQCGGSIKEMPNFINCS